MKKLLHIKISAILILLFTISFNSNATLITNVLTGVNGLVNITELDLGTGDIEYQLSSGSLTTATLAIYSFGVSNSSTTSTFATAIRPNWNATQITALTWNNGWTLNLLDGNILTTSIGSFSSLFGNDLYVNFFWLNPFSLQSNPLDAINVATGSKTQFFQIGGTVASNFVALGATGNIIDKSITSVPEPSTWMLMILVLGLMVRHSKKTITS